jgi:hypothetical protein
MDKSSTKKHFLKMRMLLISIILIFSTFSLFFNDQTRDVDRSLDNLSGITLLQNSKIETIRVNTISVEAGTTNSSPLLPVINGPRIGTKNTPYTYTISSSDADNDSIQYFISWGDGTQNTSLFLPNGTTWSISHIWGSSGKQQITVSATDNNTFSEETTLDVFIDVSFINTLGFLFDANNDGIFDSLYINQTGHVTSVKTTDLGTYYLDTNDDGNWDSLYDPSNGSLTPFGSNVTRIENPWFFIGIIVIAILIIGVIVYFYKKHYF